jgi:hypothetical protein
MRTIQRKEEKKKGTGTDSMLSIFLVVGSVKSGIYGDVN